MEQVNQFRDEIMLKEINSLIVLKDNVAVINKNWNLKQALDTLMKSGWSSVPVVNNEEEVEGIISKTLILKYGRLEKVPLFHDLQRKFVKECMEKDIPTLSSDTTLHYGIELLVDWAYLPVVNQDKKFIGILTRRSVLEYLLKVFYNEI